MLRFTQEQQIAVRRNRLAWNAHQTRVVAAAAELVGNASSIPLDAWRRIDDRATMIQRAELAVFNRLARASTTPIGLGDIVNFYGKVSDSGEAHISLDGRSEAKQDQALVTFAGTPVPVIDSFARFGWRQMATILKAGMGLDTASIANSQRRVTEKMEDLVVNGSSAVVVSGAQIYGLRNHPDRNTLSHTLTLKTATGTQLVTMFGNILAALLADNAKGRVTIFVNDGDYLAWDVNEFIAGYPKTILSRLGEIKGILEFVPSSSIPVNEIVGIADIDAGEWGTILSAMPMTTRPKARVNAEDDYVFGVLALVAPQFRSDYALQSRIVHAVQ